jgi:dTDP-4-dehydrorhamnose 3,5-epimerase
MPFEPVMSQRTPSPLVRWEHPYPTHMDIRELPIQGAFEVTPQVHGDPRGEFLEWFRADRFTEATGHPFTLAQANASVSSAGTLRGIHFAQLPPSQAKWVTCLQGAILDVVVDIRVGSPTYAEW